VGTTIAAVRVFHTHVEGKKPDKIANLGVEVRKFADLALSTLVQVCQGEIKAVTSVNFFARKSDDSPQLAQGCRLDRCRKVVSYSGLTGRDANATAKAALDPYRKPAFLLPSGPLVSCRSEIRLVGVRDCFALPFGG
jgi:hypothetical protein